MPFGHLYTFLEKKKSIQVPAYFLMQLYGFLDVELYEFFVYFGH